MAKEDEDESVDEDGGEHADEDPEVVEPQTFQLEGSADPAL